MVSQTAVMGQMRRVATNLVKTTAEVISLPVEASPPLPVFPSATDVMVFTSVRASRMREHVKGREAFQVLLEVLLT
jgi:hypothetical protein